MNKVKKLYYISETAYKKIQRIAQNNPGMSQSNIVEAAILMIPDNAKIHCETKVEYKIETGDDA